jgi:hypothetical protein
VLVQIEPGLDAEQVETLVGAATRDLDVDDEAPFWLLVDQVARLRSLSDRETSLLTAILEVVATHAEGRGWRGQPVR